jgi:type I restriction enzyme M protein
VPLPPLPLQQRVAEAYREHGVDALAFLSQLLTEGERDPISEWVEKALASLPPNTDSIHDPLDLALLDRLAAEVLPLRNEAAYGRSGESPLKAWVLVFSEAVSRLRGVRNVPRGPGLLSILQESTRGLRDALLTIKGHLPNEARARTLTKFVADWLDMACSALLNDVKLVFETDTELLQAGQVEVVPLRVYNQGPLPLRDFSITTDPDWIRSDIARAVYSALRDFGITTDPDLEQGRFDYLAENGNVEMDLAGLSPEMAGTFTLSLSWTGLTLDGRQVSGDWEMAFAVRDADRQGDDEQADLGGSPYVCNDPVGPERNDVFFGREELLDQIRRQIVESGNVVLLEGNRRSGKSSILKHLEGPNAIPGWMGICCSFQGAVGSQKGAGVPTVEVFREISVSVAKSLHMLGGETPLPGGTVLLPGKPGIIRACREGIHESSAFSDFRDYAEAALKKLSEHGLGLLLMLDEFDKLQEGIDSGVTSPQVPENIRFMIQTYPRFTAILTGLGRLRRWREEYWSALYGLGMSFRITSLSDDAARRLVTEPVRGRLIYSREAVERTISLAARQPYLIQNLCTRIFDMAARLKTRSVTLDLVEKAGDVLVEDNEHFPELWRSAKSDRRRFLLALCHRESDNPDPLRLGMIQEKLSGHGIEVDDETLITDLEFLRELELVNLVNDSSGGQYALTIPLMGMWIAKHQDFSAVRSRARSETEDQRE